MFRVKLLTAGKLLALAVFISIAAALVAYLTLRDEKAEAGPYTQKLQGRVVAVFSNTRYAHEVEGQVRFVLTAGVDKAYEDGTHELEQVKLESRGAEGTRNDVITSDRAKLSDPSDLTKLDAEFQSNVVVQTTDGLIIKTEYLRYDHLKNTVETKEVVEFEGRNLSGRSTGMLVEATDERVHLIKDVDVTIKPGGGKASQPLNKKALKQGRLAARSRGDEGPEDRAARKARKRAKRAKRANRPGGSTQIASSKPARIRGESALLEKKDHRVTFSGKVSVTQGTDEMRADRMVAFVSAANEIERVEARGNSYLKEGDQAEIKSADMDFFFGEGQELLRAVATGGAYARSTGPGPLRESSAQTIEALFAQGPSGNAAESVKAEGNALLRVHPAKPVDDKANPTMRELAASVVTMHLSPDGRNIRAAEASENAVMTVTPVRAEPAAEKKTIRAPVMNATFYEEGNRVKTFNATGGVRVESEPLVANARPARVTTSRELTAEFASESQDIEKVSQQGDFKYLEGDRHAVAERATYDGQSEVLSLRGKRPTAWDAKARTQADEIDYDRRADTSHARGEVRTTYYSRETANDSTPFKNTKSPIFITAERADARNKEGVVVYIGNARGWQDDNFVKADRIEIYEKDKKMVATGNVESTLYSVKRDPKSNGRDMVPGFASAARMVYSDVERLLHYDGAVKARQGSDRIDADAVDVYLKKETNEVDRMTAEGKVALAQPGRRGTGDKFLYSGEDGRSVLTGKTARVEDDEKGATMGSELTFYSRDDKISVENKQGTGRVRSTHRLTKQQ